MKKTFITILLTSLILYTVGMMTVFAPKAEAAGVWMGPFDILNMCCTNSVEDCCRNDCYEKWCPDGDITCFGHYTNEIDVCEHNCYNSLRTYCYYAGFDS